ncbi:unnamed protein product [Auanema sp. JU1783]|nr:unnamed protein product [Auanema sp. JU1783]
MLVQRSQVDRIVERIVSLFEPGCIRESYDELLDFGTSMKGIQPESIRDQNNFLFRYLIGWMGLFFHFSTEAAELRYLDPNSVKVHNPLMEKEETSNYLSRLVYNPTFGEIEKYERFGLLKMIYGGDTKRIAKSCVGSKVFKELDDETKQTLRNAVAKRKITNELPRSSRQIGGLSKVFSSIVIEGISRDLFPEENIESCRKNIRSCLQYLNFYKPKKDTHIFETLDPCCDPVPVPFIERLNELGLSMDFQRAVFYNSMYFFKIFSLQVIRVYRNLIEEERCTHNEYKHKLAAKNIEFINNNVTTFQSTVDEEGSIVKNTTFQTPRKNHPNLISEREELILGKSNRRSMQSGINMQQEVSSLFVSYVA